MPTIPKLSSKRRKTFKTQKRQEVYQSGLWQRMRLAQLRNEPLCQVCLLQEKITLADSVHHLKSFMEAQTTEERDQLAFDSENLCSICSSCHSRIHNGDLKGCESLEQIETRLKQINNNIQK